MNKSPETLTRRAKTKIAQAYMGLGAIYGELDKRNKVLDKSQITDLTEEIEQTAGELLELVAMFKDYMADPHEAVLREAGLSE